jgi:hypothetical protein
MDRGNITTLLLKRGRDFVVVNNKNYMFSWGGIILSDKTYEIEALLNNPDMLAEVQKSEFNLVDNTYYDKATDSYPDNIEVVSQAYLEKRHRLNDSEETFMRYVQSSEIASFYLLEVDLVVKGIRIPYNHYLYYKYDRPDMLYVSSYPSYKSLAVEEVPAPLDHLSKAYLVPLKDIDQIIGVKYYRDPNFIGKDDCNKFTGEKEEVVLDLNNFDMEVYQFFKDHDAVEIEFLR